MQASDFQNATPHTVVLLLEDGRELSIPPCGLVARVETKETVTATLGGKGGIPTVTRDFGVVTLPPRECVDPGDGGDLIIKFLLVSSLVLEALKVGPEFVGMTTVFAPDSGPTAIRENGQVKAVTRLIRLV